MIVQKAKKNKKGLSGAITALILVIASVIIALVVVFFAFGYLGAFSSSPTVTQIGTGKILTTTEKLCVTLSSNTQTEIVKVEVGSCSANVACTISAGTHQYQITLPSITYAKGQTYTIDLVLSNGEVVTVSAIAC
jgi:flagellar basal body-associated protein FliL